MYKQFIRPLLFRFDPEEVHHLTFNTIRLLNKMPGVSFFIKGKFQIEDKRLEREVFGLKFKNPVGLAAGFDKDAKLFNELSDFGFGFIEIGTLTPKAQEGNPKKRLFRLLEDSAIINRMGFNNGGVQDAVHRLKKNKGVLIGGNIGKNKATSNENAVDDYKVCFEALYDYVDYFVVNVSSPNTPGLRELQDKEPLTNLLRSLQELNFKKYVGVEAMQGEIKPILLKIAPDLTNEQLLDIIDIVKNSKIAGVIATNTTISREGLQSPNKNEIGGLSGKPLKDRSTEVIRFLSENSNKAFPIIGVGGIHSAQDAIDKLNAGASLVQLYTGFIYEGPALIKAINKKILEQA
ncbi:MULTISPECIES: quinone-dependent dihydroorotate dehydrogenase [Flavobacterium]|uniref:Dihydroorotate dehydrogenase (quinone) n=1 Tax=Flavobacterium columnare TaxID=996 RepID=A0AA94F3H4_9FLAO|nr:MULTISPECIES: quinone-dependent dihydroorotate dehydrogenase [Flavobacterium]OXA71819.1 dihydroorotate dehydrogenase (quinone) [Flavobacterium columnare NBRC 100251 = ATCC 23463]MCH4831109.1 quinone-dependent dihydroorotate dehydrogenase [Flavobacterium columnare]MCH4832950.1 quinone-dependent dihydroorotate dehydrogenase [Flavobacterium columnare]MCJ1806307.1 quinone-dependent dihydroorotate dehydrogenase [Flavobacterium covae]QYS90677.1 quinone-dependent dihydroorotate dehydrogenase [Flav